MRLWIALAALTLSLPDIHHAQAQNSPTTERATAASPRLRTGRRTAATTQPPAIRRSGKSRATMSTSSSPPGCTRPATCRHRKWTTSGPRKTPAESRQLAVPVQRHEYPDRARCRKWSRTLALRSTGADRSHPLFSSLSGASAITRCPIQSRPRPARAARHRGHARCAADRRRCRHRPAVRGLRQLRAGQSARRDGRFAPGYVAVTSAPTIVRNVVVVGHQVLDGQRRMRHPG